jgi:hypothetical protein
MHRPGSWVFRRVALLMVGVGLLGGCGGSGAKPSAVSHSAALTSSSSGSDFLTYRNPNAHYHLRYPQGWRVSPGVVGNAVRIGEPGNAILITTRPAKRPPTVTAQRAVLAMQKKAGTILKVESQPRKVKLHCGPAVRMVVTTRQPVPGRITRYVLYHSGVIVTLYIRSPLSVESAKTNAFIADSFGWDKG